jgi:hypothetical protein
MASTSTKLSVNSVNNEINGVLLVMMLVLLSIQLRQQPNLTTIQHDNDDNDFELENRYPKRSIN